MPRQDDEPTTIPEILDMEPSRSKDEKAWIGGTFEAVVRRAKRIQPKGVNWHFFTCYLHDPQNDHIAIKATSDVDFVSMEGDLVEVSGNGISREQYLKGTDYPSKYEGDPEIKMGKNAQVQVIGSGRAPSGSKADSGRGRETATTAATGGDGKKGKRVPYGPAVGGSLEIASRAISAMKNPPQPGTSEWAKLLFEVGSDVLRLNEVMEKGLLADMAKVREGGVDEEAEAEKKAEAERKAKEEATRKAAEEAERRAQEEANEDDEDLEDDVPF